MFFRKFLALTFISISLLLSGCGEAEPVPTPVLIVAFGDSLTSGHRVPLDAAFPQQLERRFYEKGYTGVRVINHGLAGDTTRGGIARLPQVLEMQPDIVILELGANDLLRQSSPEDAKHNLATIIMRLQEENIRIILAGVEPPAVLAIGNPHIGRYRKIYDELADEYDVTLYPNFLEGVQGKPDLNLEDRLHPNHKGLTVITSTFYPLIEAVVQKHLEDS